MEPNRFLLEGATLEELKARILSEHGADARIVAAERVTVGGIRGFFAKRHFEVTVEVPERRRRGAHSRLDLQARLGIAALLDDADAAEARLQADLQPTLSTDSADFAYLMDELTFQAEPEPAPIVLTSTRVRDADTGPMPVQSAMPPFVPSAPKPAPATQVPRPLSGHGDLVVLVGLPDAALQVARSMALTGAGEVLVAGAARSGDAERADDRRTALSARARGVERGQTGFVAFGLGGNLADSMALVAALADTLAPIGADQVWLVVEAGRKPSDTGRWAAALAAITQIDAVAVVGAATTGTPGTVDELGLPIGWVDGAPATATTLAAVPSLPGLADGSR
ncbi:hypothetical protein RCH16_001943 [Cryobacterium sp. MP_M5]|uniref:hypothetical protein n=1 Tax=unclassified Cryobacterium TaxID=2649013 RepID=UPI0018CB0942|nr:MULTISPECIES: hypothetical protein [unclassified Cryobacterium]MBG6058415.1 hypothetical protein [Cryobacterium sp. MP_M3]MEC5176933.1 hypothetical protein [Cryobacterium sp. MP_M5]